MVRRTWVMLLGSVVAPAAMASFSVAHESSAYSFSSFQYYLKNNNGQSHYAYRTLQFQWCCWYDNNTRASLQSIGFSARIPSVGWAYYGWMMRADGPIYYSSATEEPGFAMDSNNGWVQRSKGGVWGDYYAGGVPITVRATTCESSTVCGTPTQADGVGARIVGTISAGATSGAYSSSAY